MKKMSVIFLVLLVIVAAAATAECQDPKSNDVTTVAEARISGADTKAVLHGHFIKKINNNKYVFQDATGEIIVDLGTDKAGSLPANESAEVSLEGRVEQDLIFAGIEAQKISVLN
ncbi:Predicted protein YdeI with OB-fold, BOF family [Maridesulfovibrio ferrireducens]|uniref:Uncharacterized protein n=2 Tax=Maridesulfovibrio ferrireducens TaxID=246191 RepID=A0A1G9KLZ1_9BACT|nr:Predicted protein YdeI with OB-fold, BOF family [Maridesulfovibrio ferrireducens]